MLLSVIRAAHNTRTFVKSLDTVDLAKDCSPEPVAHLTNSDNEVADAEPDEQLADSVNKAPDVEANNVKEEIELTVKKAKTNRKRKKKREASQVSQEIS